MRTKGLILSCCRVRFEIAFKGLDGAKIIEASPSQNCFKNDEETGQMFCDALAHEGANEPESRAKSSLQSQEGKAKKIGASKCVSGARHR